MLSLLLAASLAVQAAAVPAPAPPLALPPTPAQVWAIPDELRAALHQQVTASGASPELRLHRLVMFLFGTDGLALKYDGEANLSVAESYRLRRVNCLSFTLLAVALAREVGLEAQAQQIDRIWTWGLNGDIVMQTMHANAVVTVGPRRYVLDIATNRASPPTADHRISDEHLLALYYGNRAMDFLANQARVVADAWMQAALRHEQADATLWNNAAVVRRQLGDDADAERMLLHAMRLNPELTSGYANLVSLYREHGDGERSAYWQARAQKALRHDPYYQYNQGQLLEREGALAQAINHYQRAISLQGREPLFHYSLGRAYFQQGKLRRADREISKAQKLSQGPDRTRFQAKLEALRRLTTASATH